MVNTSDLKKLKVSELRDELAKRDLDTAGVKGDLISRLAAAMEQEEALGGASAGEAAGDAVPGDGAQAEGQGSQDAEDMAADEEGAGHAEIPPAAAAAVAMDAEGAPIAEGMAPTDKPAVEPAAAPAEPNGAAPAAAPAAPGLSEAEKIKMRKERFGAQLDPEGKKAAIDPLGQVDPKEEIERRKKRAARFGLPIPVIQAEEDAKKKARADRFGLPVAAAAEAAKNALSPPKKAEEDAKKKARAERFGLPAAGKGPAAGAAAGAKPAAAGLSEEEQKKRAERAKRFGAEKFEDKKQARAERFGIKK